MDQATLWLSILMMVTMAALVTPQVVRLNRGRAIRNAALWLLIVLALGMIYHLFGPFGMAADSLPARSPAVEKFLDGEPDGSEAQSGSAKDSGKSGGYTPPEE